LEPTHSERQQDFGIREARARRADMLDGPGRAGPGKTLVSFRFGSSRTAAPQRDSALDTILRTLELAREERSRTVTRARGRLSPCVCAVCVHACVRPRTCVRHELRIARGLSRNGLSLRAEGHDEI